MDDQQKEGRHADYQIARAQIEHENALTNQRFTWLLTSNTFLLAAYGLIFKELVVTADPVKVAPAPFWAWCFLFILSVYGLLQACLIGRSLYASWLQHKHVKEWWYERYPEFRLSITGGDGRTTVTQCAAKGCVLPKVCGDELGDPGNPAHIAWLAIGVWVVLAALVPLVPAVKGGSAEGVATGSPERSEAARLAPEGPAGAVRGARETGTRSPEQPSAAEQARLRGGPGPAYRATEPRTAP